MTLKLRVFDVQKNNEEPNRNALKVKRCVCIVTVLELIVAKIYVDES